MAPSGRGAYSSGARRVPCDPCTCPPPGTVRCRERGWPHCWYWRSARVRTASLRVVRAARARPERRCRPPHRRPPAAACVESSRSTEQGTRTTSGGCVAKLAESLPRGSRVTLRIVEYDPQTCEYVLARGSLRQHPAPAPGSRSMAAAYFVRGKPFPSTGPIATLDACDPAAEQCCDNMDTCGGSGGGDAGGASGGFLASGMAMQDLIVYDPVGAVVNQDQNTIQYTWNMATRCVVSATGRHYTYWLVYSGWSQKYSYAFPAGGGCSTGGTTTSGYHNGFFCTAFGYIGEGATDIDYTTNQVIVTPGQPTYFVQMAYLTGGCRSFLGYMVDRVS
jgi:hypothetical protein